MDVSRYVSNVDGNVFVIKNLPEEVIAVLFAKYSRSKSGLRDNIVELLGDEHAEFHSVESDLAQNRASRFHEKWVIGYSHGSVAEHAVVHIALENLSILASKAVEDCRLASYTEKSTRYVQFGRDSFYVPEFSDGAVKQRYVDMCRKLFDTYLRLFPICLDSVKRLFPNDNGASRTAYESACRSKVFDCLRYMLPTSTLTNVGITINARSLEGMLTKLYSNQLRECQMLADEIKREALNVVPTLIRYAAPNTYHVPTWVREFCNDVKLIASGTEDDLLLYAPYGALNTDIDCLKQAINAMPDDEKRMAVDCMFADRGQHDVVPRGCEHINYMFEVIMDYGAYRDIQRHRMSTQSTQQLTPQLGFEIPEEIVAFGLADEYNRLMWDSEDCYFNICKTDPELAAYCLPLAFRVRTLVSMNLREAFHFIELRSSEQGHISYRRIAQLMYRCIASVHPNIATHIRVNNSQSPILERLNAEIRNDKKGV